MFDRQPLLPRLSSLNLEYRIIQLYSRDAGPREAALSMEYVVRAGVAGAPERDSRPGRAEVVIKATRWRSLRLCGLARGDVSRGRRIRQADDGGFL